jgi:hypothetical protein
LHLRLLLSLDVMQPLTWFWYLNICWGARSPMVPISTLCWRHWISNWSLVI